MGRLTDSDYQSLERSYISRQYADAAQLRRVDSLEGRERVGGHKNGAGDYEGIVFPYVDPIFRQVVGERLRLDHPPVDAKGKPEHKYLSPPGQRLHFYWPFTEKSWLEDVSVPILITEGEKKYLAAHRVAVEFMENGRPLFFAIAIAGVWTWRGRTGKTNDANGHRVDVKGVIPDFDRVEWKERRVVIAFDSNALTNPKVAAARAQLARELVARGALVYLINLPGKAKDAAINGLDDFLAAAGPEAFLELYRAATRWDWRNELILTEKGKIKTNTGGANAAAALRFAPEFQGVLGFNIFANRVEIRRLTPWKSAPGEWQDLDDFRLREWLAHHGVFETKSNISDAITSVAKEFQFHPVRDYLESLAWDGTPRLDDWLTSYAGADQGDEKTETKDAVTLRSSLIQAMGSKWMISAVARAYKPGCKADYMLLLEGEQGIGKTGALAVLGGDFYTDDIPDLRTKDAQVGIQGVWIVEFSELNSMSRAENEHTKAFLSRTTDRFRAPYDRIAADHPRQCVFAGSTNREDWGSDETGLRRYWPISCKQIQLDKLRQDRDQLWAEAVARYKAGEAWYIQSLELNRAAEKEQSKRQRGDAWDEKVAKHHADHSEELTTADVLKDAINLEAGRWGKHEEMRIGAILLRLGRKKRHLSIPGNKKGARAWYYCIPDESQCNEQKRKENEK